MTEPSRELQRANKELEKMRERYQKTGNPYATRADGAAAGCVYGIFLGILVLVLIGAALMVFFTVDFPPLF